MLESALALVFVHCRHGIPQWISMKWHVLIPRAHAAALSANEDMRMIGRSSQAAVAMTILCCRIRERRHPPEECPIPFEPIRRTLVTTSGQDNTNR
jgi:hypothetical protein